MGLTKWLRHIAREATKSSWLAIAAIVAVGVLAAYSLGYWRGQRLAHNNISEQRIYVSQPGVYMFSAPEGHRLFDPLPRFGGRIGSKIDSAIGRFWDVEIITVTRFSTLTPVPIARYEPTATPTAVPPLVSRVGKAREAMRQGLRVFTVPNEMEVGQEYVLAYRASRDPSVMTSTLVMDLPESAESATFDVAPVSTSPKMKVILGGQHYLVRTLSPSTQPVPESGHVEWRWVVQPERSGARLPLELSVSGEIWAEGEWFETGIESQVYPIAVSPSLDRIHDDEGIWGSMPMALARAVIDMVTSLIAAAWAVFIGLPKVAASVGAWRAGLGGEEVEPPAD